MEKFGRHRQFAVFLIGMMLLWALFPPSVEAAIFKWKDDRGAVHFTDDINQIPRKFRKPPYLSRMPAISFPNIGSSRSGAGADSETGSETSSAPSGDSPKKENGKLTKEEKVVLQETILYLKNEIKRDEDLTQMMPSERTGKTFAASIQQSLPQKKELVQKLSELDLPAIQEAHNFLQDSLRQDEQVRVTGPRMKNRTIRLLNRLKLELKTESSLVGRLEELLRADEKKAALKKPQAGKSGK
ncbi:MAG: DUF4124 domain-containing protein [Nitrospinales bacterium]